MDHWTETPLPAVLPVLVGPLQTALALLPAVVMGLAAGLLALLSPRRFGQVARFLWRQKLFALGLAALLVSILTGWPWRGMWRGSRAALGWETKSAGDWPMFRGDPQRSGHGANFSDPTLATTVWQYSNDPTVYSSPAIAGDLVVFSTAFALDPLRPLGRGAIVALDATTGFERWRYAPDDFRATFSSPVVSDGYVVCGEGLHDVRDARVTCLNLKGERQWQFTTASHVESTPAIADRRVFVGAGDDGFYCLDLSGDTRGNPRVLWHLPGEQFPDCESSPVVVGDTVYFGLGERGQALCAVDARTGTPRWSIETPYPIFASPTWIPPTESSGAKLIIAMGNGNFAQSADEVRTARLAELKANGISGQALQEAERKLATGGQVWCIDLATQEVDWRYLTDETVLGAVAARGDRLYFACRDGVVHCLSTKGQAVRRVNLHEPIVASPALGANHAYVATLGGRLAALDLQLLQLQWEVDLSERTAHTSSPVVSHGHVYVGTTEQGLCCLGTKGRIGVAAWGRGHQGGPVDFDPFPEPARVVGRWPANDETCETAWPLSIADGQIIVIRQTSEDPRMLRLDFKSGVDNALQVAWETPCAPLEGLPPLCIGNRVITAELISRFGRPVSVRDPGGAGPRSWPHIVSRNSDDGAMHWRIPLPLANVRQWICDLRQIYLLAPDGLMAYSTRDGSPKWGLNFNEPRDGSIGLAEDILIFSDGTSWKALDTVTGVPLWKIPPSGFAVRVLDANPLHFLAASRPIEGGETQLEWRRVLDGGLVWRQPWEADSTPDWARLAADHVLILARDEQWQARRLSDGSRVEFAEYPRATDHGDSKPRAPDSASADDNPNQPNQPNQPGQSGENSESVASSDSGATSDRPRLVRALPIISRNRIIDPLASAAPRIFNLDDRTSRTWLPLDAGRPNSQMVMVQGRVYFISDRGQVLCVAAGSGP